MKPLTIGELRKAIEGYSDDTQVLIAQTPEGALSDWFNVSNEFGSPTAEDNSEYFAFTLFPVDTYDARQF
jgi:hypothetical protein